MPTQEDTPDYSHLVDDYKEPLYTYPRDDPTQQMKVAYTAQKTSRKQYDIAKQSRAQYEIEMSEKLGKLHNLLRESNEREAVAMKTLRSKTINVYEYELQEINGNDANSKFNIGISKLKQYIKKYKGLPPSLEDMDTDTTKYTNEGYEVSTWIASIDITLLKPHQCATLENLGIPLPTLTEEDNWHRSLLQFKLFAKEYYATPITVQETNGDLLQTINKKGSEVLKVWCNEQQAHYETNAFGNDMDKYTKLVDAGFTFDVHTDDTKWDEKLGMIQEFHDKFGHVHIPDDYSPKTSEGESSQVTAADLQTFVKQVTKLVYRDALSPKRLSSLKTSNLYSDIGGRVYDQHIQQYKSSCRESGVEPRTKRKFTALETMAQSKQIGKMKKVVLRRNNMDNWKAKLESKYLLDSFVMLLVFLSCLFVHMMCSLRLTIVFPLRLSLLLHRRMCCLQERAR